MKRAIEAKEKTDLSQKQEKNEMSKIEELIKENVDNVKVEQVEDAAPGELEKEDENTYIINSIEDLVVLAYTVTSGEDNFEGKTVKLGVSLDFNSVKSYSDAFRTDYGKYGYEGELKTLLTSKEGFKSIGLTTSDDKDKNWMGTFDGNNNEICNLYINLASEERNGKIGLFSNNFGNIKNVYLKNVNLHLECAYAAVGAISGQNSKSGNISGCTVSGKIYNKSTQGIAGGITSYSSGSIINCMNQSNINCMTESNGKAGTYIGGICSSTSSETIIQNCCNTGNITGKDETYILCIGGITGLDGGSGAGKILNCYNKGSIDGSGDIFRCGGIIGYGFNSIENCYNSGEMKGNGKNECYVGMLVGRKKDTFNILNSYYIKVNDLSSSGNTSENTQEIKTESEMMQDEFIKTLNNNTNVWEKDIKGINNGYPILKNIRYY